MQIDKFIVLLKEVLNQAYQEEKNEKSLWSLEQIHSVIEEMTQLLSYAEQGKIFFKYGKKQRMLNSTYILTDTYNLDSTLLGKKISALQAQYDKLI